MSAPWVILGPLALGVLGAVTALVASWLLLWWESEPRATKRSNRNTIRALRAANGDHFTRPRRWN